MLLFNIARIAENYKYHQLKNKEARLERWGDGEPNTIEAGKGQVFLVKESCCCLYVYASTVWKTDIRKRDAFSSAMKLELSIFRIIKM